MRNYLDDILIGIGCLLIIYATFRINLTAAIYVGGFLLICLGSYFGITGKKVRK